MTPFLLTYQGLLNISVKSRDKSQIVIFEPFFGLLPFSSADRGILMTFVSQPFSPDRIFGKYLSFQKIFFSFCENLWTEKQTKYSSQI